MEKRFRKVCYLKKIHPKPGSSKEEIKIFELKIKNVL